MDAMRKKRSLVYIFVGVEWMAKKERMKESQQVKEESSGADEEESIQNTGKPSQFTEGE